MNKSSERRKYLLLFALLLGPGLILIFLSKSDHSFKTLPYFGNKEVINAVAGTDIPDTLYHSVPDFSFTNQFGENTTMEDFEGDIMVVDFFFTTCPTICPIMTKQMARLQWMLEDAAYDDVSFLSHTVNPNNDTPEILLAYGQEEGADFEKWTFVTGDQEEIFEQGFQGYLLSTQEDSGAPGGFLHSSMFVLVDRDRHIRGFYDGTSSKEVDDLVTDIKMLKKEETLKESEKVSS
ncbi:MAG: protein SCO1/2 [Flammeovirgaceae bacterium]|jgi:protein SCO1/2